MGSEKLYSGKCECGKVSFQVPNLRKDLTACHCGQCRRTSGHLWASTYAPAYQDMVFTADEGLAWYASSSFATRGFCRFCGSSLFYRMQGESGVGIAIGCLDETDDFKLAKHIFVADKGEYYDICDDLPQLRKL